MPGGGWEKQQDIKRERERYNGKTIAEWEAEGWSRTVEYGKGKEDYGMEMGETWTAPQPAQPAAPPPEPTVADAGTDQTTGDDFTDITEENIYTTMPVGGDGTFTGEPVTGLPDGFATIGGGDPNFYQNQIQETPPAAYAPGTEGDQNAAAMGIKNEEQQALSDAIRSQPLMEGASGYGHLINQARPVMGGFTQGASRPFDWDASKEPTGYQPKYKVGTDLTAGNFWGNAATAHGLANLFGGGSAPLTPDMVNLGAALSPSGVDRTNFEGGSEGADPGDFGGQSIGDLSTHTEITKDHMKAVTTVAGILGIPIGQVIGMAAPVVKNLSKLDAEKAAALSAAAASFSEATGINATTGMTVDEASALLGQDINSIEALTEAFTNPDAIAAAIENSRYGVAGHGYGGYGAGSGDSPGAVGGHDPSDSDAFSGAPAPFSAGQQQADNPEGFAAGPMGGGGGGYGGGPTGGSLGGSLHGGPAYGGGPTGGSSGGGGGGGGAAAGGHGGMGPHG